MIAALKRRRDAGHGPFTGQSCDNIQGNGDTLKTRRVLSLTRLSDPALTGDTEESLHLSQFGWWIASFLIPAPRRWRWLAHLALTMQFRSPTRALSHVGY